MKKYFVSAFLAFVFMQATSQVSPGHNDSSSGVMINNGYSLGKELQSIMDRYTAKDLPGVSMAVYTEKEGWWAGASGYAKTESKKPMTANHLQYLQSITKTYAAVAGLKLVEEGKLDLEAPITKYLPEKYNRLIPN